MKEPIGTYSLKVVDDNQKADIVIQIEEGAEKNEYVIYEGAESHNGTGKYG